MTDANEELMGLEIRDEYAPMVAGLMKEKLFATSELRAQIDACVAKVRRAAKKDDLLDVELVESLAQGCRDLLDEVDANPAGDKYDRFRLLTQVATRYFILEEDSDGDLDSVLGFDDDASVFNAIVRALDRASLKVLF